MQNHGRIPKKIQINKGVRWIQQNRKNKSPIKA